MAEPAIDWEKLVQEGGAGNVPTSPEDWLALVQGGGPQAPKRSFAGGLAHQAARGLTMGFSDKLLSDEGVASNKRFEKEHPWWSGGAQAGGAVVGAVTPLGWAGRAGAVPRWLLGQNNIARASAPGAGLFRRLNAYGSMGAKQAAGWELSQDQGSMRPEASTGDSVKDFANEAKRRFVNVGTAQVPGYLLGAAGGWAGDKVGAAISSRLAGVGHAATLGRMPNRGAVLDVAHEIGNDAPAGMGVRDITGRIRDLAFGERYLARHGSRNIPHAEERAMMTQFQELMGQGMTEPQAARQIAQQLGTRAQTAAQHAAQGGRGQHPDAWLLRNGNPFTAGTMEGWARTAGTRYGNINQVPSNLAELIALASGGEAPATQTTLKKLLNLKSEGGNRSEFLRTLRDRQRAISAQMQDVVRRYRGQGDVGDMIAQHERNAQNANALYQPVLDQLTNMGDEARQGLQGALRPVIEGVQRQVGHETDDISRAALKHAEKFMNPIEVQGAGSMRPLTKTVSEGVNDAGEQVQRIVPMRRITQYGDEITEVPTAGGKFTQWEPTGDMQSILRRRAALGDAIQDAPRGSAMKRELTQLKEQIDDALRGMGSDANGATPLQQAMHQWGVANDTRALAGSLDRAYREGVGLNMMPKKGDALIDLERFLRRFQAMDAQHQDVARRGVLDQFVAMLDTKGDLADAARIFSNPRTRAILTRIIGEDATEEFGGFVAKAGLASNTFNMNKGSPTASIMDADKQSGWLSNIAGALFHGNPLRALGHAGEAVGDHFKRQKHNAMTGMYSADVRNPRQLEEVLAQIERASRPVNRGLDALGRAGGGAGGTFGTYTAQKQQRREQ